MAFSPVFAFAQSTLQTGTLDSIVNFVGRTIKSVIPIVFGLAIIYFFWGLAKFVRSAGDPKAQAEGRGIMIYGVIAIAVMLSVYGLVYWLQGVFGLQNSPNLPIPTVNIPTQ